MYYAYSALSAVLIAVMIVVNGELMTAYDTYSSTVIIHAVGLLLITGIVLWKKEKPASGPKLPAAAYLGGAIGVATIVFNNLAFHKISVSAIVALSLLGQTVTALVIDQFGFFGLPVKRFNKAKLAGLLFTGGGVAVLLLGSEFALLPVLFSVLSGVSVVTSRCVNARLAEKRSVLISTWYNYLIGLAVACAVWAVAGGMGASSLPTAVLPRPELYLGGVIGVFVVVLSNVATMKLPAFHMTLILFVGQVFTGILLDAFLSQGISQCNLIGGFFVTGGLCVNVWLDSRAVKQKAESA